MLNWKYILEFGDNYAKLEDSLRQTLRFLDFLQNSVYFKQFLQILITVGNFLNAGTARGGAYGVKLQSLQKFSGTKDNKGNSLLYNIMVIASGVQHSSELYESYLANIQEYMYIFSTKKDSEAETQYPRYAVQELVELSCAAKRAGWCDIVDVYSSLVRDYQTLK